MGRFSGILICTDLDGTLYRNDKTVSRENREAVEYFKREGGLFTFITGRMPYYSRDAYNAASPNVAFGCVNGGGLYDGEKNEYLWRTELTPRVMELVRAVDESVPSVGIQVCGFENTYFLKENDNTVRFRALTGVPYLPCDYGNISEPIGKIIFGSEQTEDIAAVAKALNAHPMAADFEFIRSSRTLMEILPKGVHKGLALIKLVERLQIDINKTVAIGDYNNDIGMFGAARYGIAVSNACREALEAADMVTVSNEEHGVAQVIRDIENGKIRL